MNGGGHSVNELKVFKRGNRKGQYLKNANRSHFDISHHPRDKAYDQEVK